MLKQELNGGNGGVYVKEMLSFMGEQLLTYLLMFAVATCLAILRVDWFKR